MSCLFFFFFCFPHSMRPNPAAVTKIRVGGRGVEHQSTHDVHKNVWSAHLSFCALSSCSPFPLLSFFSPTNMEEFANQQHCFGICSIFSSFITCNKILAVQYLSLNISSLQPFNAPSRNVKDSGLASQTVGAYCATLEGFPRIHHLPDVTLGGWGGGWFPAAPSGRAQKGAWGSGRVLDIGSSQGWAHTSHLKSGPSPRLTCWNTQRTPGRNICKTHN